MTSAPNLASSSWPAFSKYIQLISRPWLVCHKSEKHYSCLGTIIFYMFSWTWIFIKSDSISSRELRDAYHVNTLYNGMIDCFSTVPQSSIASNESFTYKHGMQEKDYRDFVLAMVPKVDDHEKINNWTIMQPCDMPANSKTVKSIWSFKRN